MSVAVTPVTAPPAKVGRVITPAGIEVWHVESHVVPLVALSFVFEGGAAQDPAGKAGLAQLTARLLDEGAGPYASTAFHERLADHAIEMAFNAGPDSLGGSLKTLTRHADEAFDLLRLALSEPRFEEADIERVRAQTMAGLRYQMKDPGVAASKRFFAEAFPGHAYGTPTSGTLDTLPTIGRDDVVALHRAQAARGRLKVAIVGAIGADEVARRVDHAFGALPAEPTLAPVAPVRLSGIGDRHVVEFDVPQSVIRFATDGLPWSDPDFIPAYVLNHVLGGGAFTSRLFQEVREKRGLAYSVGSSLANFRCASMTWGFTATKNERVAEALSVISGEIDRLREEGPSADELDKAKAYLTGSYALGFDTSTKIANQLVQIAFNDLGIDYVARRNALVSAVTAEDVRRAGARMLGDGRLLTVIAGKPEL
ncbi:M16 family metallopeptidase [Salinarimonas ramus]|uniref:Peptidase M16 n=1 Tax=Salinarimonas ramus TaxID=690164 RepID=A0A917QAY4_9HYPH|nr:pitrilysin family protein [Salinarimonas ramus]GGK40206.1 peptidase M16 [Salinarimonas ramus]